MTNVHFAIMLADGRKIRYLMRTPPRQRLTLAGLDALLEQQAARITHDFPGREFRLVPLAGGRSFNFVEVPAAA